MRPADINPHLAQLNAALCFADDGTGDLKLKVYRMWTGSGDGGSVSEPSEMAWRTNLEWFCENVLTRHHCIVGVEFDQWRDLDENFGEKNAEREDYFVHTLFGAVKKMFWIKHLRVVCNRRYFRRVNVMRCLNEESSGEDRPPPSYRGDRGDAANPRDRGNGATLWPRMERLFLYMCPGAVEVLEACAGPRLANVYIAEHTSYDIVNQRMARALRECPNISKISLFADTPIAMPFANPHDANTEARWYALCTDGARVVSALPSTRVLRTNDFVLMSEQRTFAKIYSRVKRPGGGPRPLAVIDPRNVRDPLRFSTTRRWLWARVVHVRTSEDSDEYEYCEHAECDGAGRCQRKTEAQREDDTTEWHMTTAELVKSDDRLAAYVRNRIERLIYSVCNRIGNRRLMHLYVGDRNFPPTSTTPVRPREDRDLAKLLSFNGESLQVVYVAHRNFLQCEEFVAQLTQLPALRRLVFSRPVRVTEARHAAAFSRLVVGCASLQEIRGKLLVNAEHLDAVYAAVAQRKTKEAARNAGPDDVATGGVAEFARLSGDDLCVACVAGADGAGGTGTSLAFAPISPHAVPDVVYVKMARMREALDPFAEREVTPRERGANAFAWIAGIFWKIRARLRGLLPVLRLWRGRGPTRQVRYAAI